MKQNSIRKQVKTSRKLFKLNTSIDFSKSLTRIYQQEGKTCANFKTKAGNHSAGTNAPQRKADPKAITFTIPLTAFFFLNNSANK